MPVLESEKRKLQLKADTDRRDQLIEALRETDWVEAFLEDSHYKKFCVIVRNTRDAVTKNREGVIAQLSAPLAPDVRSQLNEGLLVATTSMQTIDGILNWADGLADKLKEARKELPSLEKKIKDGKK